MAASFGKVTYLQQAFLGPNDIDHNLIRQAALYLKVVFQLKSELHFRTITLEQLKEIKDANLVGILLRYKKHYLAYEIAQHLGYSQHLISRILVDWACCKIESDT